MKIHQRIKELPSYMPQPDTAEKLWYVFAFILMFPFLAERFEGQYPRSLQLLCPLVGYVFFGIKIFFLDRTSLKQKGIAALFLALGVLSTLASGTHLCMDTFVMVFGARNIPYRKICRYFGILFTVSLVVSLAGIPLGLITNETFGRPESGIVRYSMGFEHPNVFGQWIMMITFSVLLSLEKSRKSVPALIVLVIINAIAYRLTDSRASLLGSVFLIAVVPCAALLSRRLDKMRWIPAAASILIVGIALAFWAITYYFNMESRWQAVLNGLFSQRLLFTNEAYHTYSITLFGQDLTLVSPLDAFYAYIPYRAGVLAMAAYLILEVAAVWRGAKNGQWDAVAVCLILAVYSTMEYDMARACNLSLYTATALLAEKQKTE